MSKTVWIINQYASTPSTGMGGRQFYLARELALQGYKVYLIASSANHLLRQRQVFDKPFRIDSVDGISFVWINMPQYSEAHSKQRAINWFLFAWRLQILNKAIVDKPDAILCSSPSPIAFLGAHRLAKQHNCRLIFEVRDIWPLTLTEIGGYSVKHPFIRFMQWVEDRAYNKSDRVVSNLKNAVKHMTSRGMSSHKFKWIPSGFSMNEVNLKVSLDINTERQLPKDKFLVGYTGTFGVANALDTLLNASLLLSKYPEIAFVLVGAGKERHALEKLVRKHNLSNVYFINSIPKVEVQAMLSKFDVCFIGWLNDPIYEYGIGANKIPEYLLSGKPVIHAYSGSCDPIKEANAGITVPAENAKLLANAIYEIYSMTTESRERMGSNGRQFALDNYEYGRLSRELAMILF